MPLETGTFINDLAPTNPLSSDPVGQGDDHLRLIKTAVQTTFPQMGSVFGLVRSQDTAVSISSTWNTNHLLVTASATTTVVLTLPPSASVTAGYYVDISTLAGAAVSLLPSGAGSINGAASFSIPEQNTARAYFTGGTSWRADSYPNGQTSSVFGTQIIGRAGLTISGATTLGGATVINGALSVSGNAVLTGTLSVSGVATFGGAATFSGAVRLLSTLSVGGSTVLNAMTTVGNSSLAGVVTLTGGQVAFPATQAPSADANTLDDYEEGSWVPTFLPATVGTASFSYTTRLAEYTKVGRLVTTQIAIAVTGGTIGTGSGSWTISGFPFAAVSSAVVQQTASVSEFDGFTLTANHENMAFRISGSEATMITGGSGVAIASGTVANTPGVLPLILRLTMSYITT